MTISQINTFNEIFITGITVAQSKQKIVKTIILEH